MHLHVSVNTMRTWKLFSGKLDANTFLSSSEYSEAKGLYGFSAVQMAGFGVKIRRKKYWWEKAQMKIKKKGNLKSLLISMGFLIPVDWRRWEKADKVEKQIPHCSTAGSTSRTSNMEQPWIHLDFFISWTGSRICSPFQKIIVHIFFSIWERMTF